VFTYLKGDRYPIFEAPWVILEIVKRKYMTITSPMLRVVIGLALFTRTDIKSPAELNSRFKRKV
jgi:hypothetical protein